MAADHHPRSPDEVIRGAGLRVTESRRAVLMALREHAHSRADEVYARVLHTVTGTSLQSVYNALGDFVSAGLVRRIEPSGHPGLYELRVHDNHHHVVCTSCGAIEDVDCEVGHAPCLTPPDIGGFTLQTSEITFWGLCPSCAITVEHPVDHSQAGKP